MPRQLLRVVETRRLDNPDDQRTPAEVAATDTSAANLEVFVQSIITQVRRLLGTGDWKDDPLYSLATLHERFVWSEGATGVQNGVNLTFTTAFKFLPDSIRVYFNGVRLHVGASNDFTIAESGGIGTGYDTVTFVAPEMAPKPEESVLVDYVKAL